MKWDKYLSVGVAGVGICVNYVWGGLDTMMIALLTLMVLDFLAGVLCGARYHELDSNRAYLGITRKKMMILVMVAVAVVVDDLLNLDGTVRSIAIFYYVSMEGLSIIENAGKLGFPVPDSLKEKFLQLKEGDE